MMEPHQEHFPTPREGFLLTHFITSRDVERSTAFYRDVVGGEVVTQGEPTAVKLANTWIIINVGGSPTDDKLTSCWSHRATRTRRARSSTSALPTSRNATKNGGARGR